MLCNGDLSGRRYWSSWNLGFKGVVCNADLAPRGAGGTAGMVD